VKVNRLLKNTSITLGLASIALFVFNYYVFSILRPLMVALEPISSSKENLLPWVGVGLLLFLAFNLLSLYRLVRHLRKAKKISVLSLLLLVCGILSFLFVFSDVALLSDIGKQYRYNLAQPEWLLVYIIMGFQLIVTAVFTYLHLFGFRQEQQIEHVVRDNNIFLVSQYVGLVCGLMGISLFSLGFFYSNSWNLDMHVTITSILLLSPYTLALIYWLVTKLQEKNRQWYDEKQVLDVGRSAFLTLISSVIIMTLLFVFNYNNLEGIIRLIWLPLYLFSTLFIFSISNLYFSTRY
jgi:hypothetical protein